jgi:hypothetical protein
MTLPGRTQTTEERNLIEESRASLRSAKDMLKELKMNGWIGSNMSRIPGAFSSEVETGFASRKMRQSKNLEPRFDSIEVKKALVTPNIQHANLSMCRRVRPSCERTGVRSSLFDRSGCDAFAVHQLNSSPLNPAH